MTALQAHVTSEDHAGLAFHSGCPVCRRERLSGTLPPTAIVGPRARALLAAGILAGSTAASAAGPSLASTPEEAELGGLLDQVESVPLTPEEQAEIDAEAGAPPEDPLEAEDAPDPAPPEVPAEPAPPAPPQTPAVQPAPPPQPAVAAPPAPAVDKPPPAPKPKRKSPRARPVQRPVATPTPVPVPVTPVSVPRAAPGASRVVRPGESLWSIARDLLGPRASNARIAREVARIWSLNASAIGTGDPDLVMAGQRLRLPGHD